MNKVNALILAAGSSIRMKTPKPFLQFNQNTTFIEKIIKTYRDFACDEIVIVVNKHNSELFSKLETTYISVVINENLEFERFYSVKLGFGKMKDCEYSFLQDADNPFITCDILNYIYSAKLPDKYIIPCYKGKGGHPILLPESTISKLKNDYENNANLKSVLNDFKSHKLEIPFEEILININSPEDYNKYFSN